MKENPFLYAIKFFFCTLLKKTVFEEIKFPGLSHPVLHSKAGFFKDLSSPKSIIARHNTKTKTKKQLIVLQI